jgi:TonB family protein
LKPPDRAKPQDAPKKSVLSPDDLKVVGAKTPATKPATKPSNTPAPPSSKPASSDRSAIASQIASSVRSLSKNLSSSTKVEMPGPDAGPAMVNYMDIVASKYTAAWNPPASLDDDAATVIATVIIARDGRVIDHRITKPSGNAAMDSSIQTTLDNVPFVAPFPAESRDQQRSFSIKFNLAAKRSLG